MGLTACVPPFGCRAYVLPSVPVTVTWVALLAVTVNVEDPPAATDAGLATMVTVGAIAALTVRVAVAVAVAPPPVAIAV